jgi:EAL domain-containing protein (putative c-di-GMP-specific phosphodiesterase class I)
MGRDVNISPDVCSDVLERLGATAFTLQDGRYRWAGVVDFPVDAEAFEEALGEAASLRRLAIAAQEHYKVRYTVGDTLYEETGRRLGKGELVGIVRIIETRARAKWELLSLETLLSVLNERRVTLAYQPIVDARTREPEHYECLLRVALDDREWLPAVQVIESAESLGLVHLLDRRALEIAARSLIGRQDLKLALNVSAQTVANLDASNDYLDALKMLGIAARRLTLELTETVAVTDPTLAARFATKARALGCRFAIDDFGSGYTTFRNLMAIEADSIKIDGDFVDDLLTSAQSQTFVRMMVDLAQTFGVQTVAERVETVEVADLLTEIGVDHLQGYYFGKPMLGVPSRQAA